MKTLNSINIRDKITKSYIYKTSLIQVRYTDHMIKIKPEVGAQTVLCHLCLVLVV